MSVQQLIDVYSFGSEGLKVWSSDQKLVPTLHDSKTIESSGLDLGRDQGNIKDDGTNLLDLQHLMQYVEESINNGGVVQTSIMSSRTFYAMLMKQPVVVYQYAKGKLGWAAAQQDPLGGQSSRKLARGVQFERDCGATRKDGQFTYIVQQAYEGTLGESNMEKWMKQDVAIVSQLDHVDEDFQIVDVIVRMVKEIPSTDVLAKLDMDSRLRIAYRKAITRSRVLLGFTVMGPNRNVVRKVVKQRVEQLFLNDREKVVYNFNERAAFENIKWITATMLDGNIKAASFAVDTNGNYTLLPLKDDQEVANAVMKGDELYKSVKEALIETCADLAKAVEKSTSLTTVPF